MAKASHWQTGGKTLRQHRGEGLAGIRCQFPMDEAAPRPRLSEFLPPWVIRTCPGRWGGGGGGCHFHIAFPLSFGGLILNPLAQHQKLLGHPSVAPYERTLCGVVLHIGVGTQRRGRRMRARKRVLEWRRLGQHPQKPAALLNVSSLKVSLESPGD